jgi:hypothetical protein
VDIGLEAELTSDIVNWKLDRGVVSEGKVNFESIDVDRFYAK